MVNLLNIGCKVTKFWRHLKTFGTKSEFYTLFVQFSGRIFEYEGFGVESGPAAHAGCRDGLTVARVGAVAGRKDSVDRGDGR